MFESDSFSVLLHDRLQQNRRCSLCCQGLYDKDVNSGFHDDPDVEKLPMAKLLDFHTSCVTLLAPLLHGRRSVQATLARQPVASTSGYPPCAAVAGSRYLKL